MLGTDCTKRADFAHRFADAGKVNFVLGLRSESFVYVNVLCVEIMLAIVVVLYLCVRYVLSSQVVASVL